MLTNFATCTFKCFMICVLCHVRGWKVNVETYQSTFCVAMATRGQWQWRVWDEL